MTAFTTDIQDGVARVLFDLPGEPINKITAGVREELGPLLNQLRGDRNVRAVVLMSAKPARARANPSLIVMTAGTM